MIWCELSPMSPCVWMLGPQPRLLFEKDRNLFGGLPGEADSVWATFEDYSPDQLRKTTLCTPVQSCSCHDAPSLPWLSLASNCEVEETLPALRYFCGVFASGMRKVTNTTTLKMSFSFLFNMSSWDPSCKYPQFFRFYSSAIFHGSDIAESDLNIY